MDQKQKLLEYIRMAETSIAKAEEICLDNKTTIPEDIRDDVYKLRDDAESLIEDLE